MTGSSLYLWILTPVWPGSYWERPLLSYYRKSISEGRELSRAQKEMNSEMGTVMQENLSKRDSGPLARGYWLPEAEAA